MAAVLSIMGGTVGFVAALIALVFFGAPLLTAFLVWVGAGCAVVMLGIARAMVPQPAVAPHASHELA